MYQRNRNLFSLLAVLFTASLITGIGGIFLLLADQIGSGPRLVANTSISDSDSAAEVPAFRTLGTHPSTVLSVAVGDRTPIMASGSYDNTVKLWNRNSGEDTALPHSGRVNDLVFTPDGEQLLTGSGAGNIKLWSIAGNLQSSIQSDSGRILSLAVNATGEIIASGSNKGILQIWSTDSRQLQLESTLANIGPRINTLAFHPTEANILISGNQDGLIQIWDIERAEIIQTLDDNADRIVSIAISNNGQYLASGSYDQSIRVWDLEAGDLLQVLDGHNFSVADVAFSPDGTTLASSSYDESIKTWNWNSGRTLCTLEGHSGFVYSVAFTDSGNTLVSGGYDGTVRTWDLTATSNQDCLPR